MTRCVLVAFAAVLLAGCWSTRSSEASLETTTGVQGGQPVDLTTVRRSQSDEQTTVDIAPIVKAAVAAATGDIRSAVQALSSAPKPATPDELVALIRQEVPGGSAATAAGALGGAGGLALLALREWLAHRKTRQDGDEAWDAIKRQAEGAPKA